MTAYTAWVTTVDGYGERDLGVVRDDEPAACVSMRLPVDGDGELLPISAADLDVMLARGGFRRVEPWGPVETGSAARVEPVGVRYLSRGEVARRVGVAPDTLGRYSLPAPDAWIGTTRGWLPETVDRWQAARPGRGARTDLRQRS